MKTLDTFDFVATDGAVSAAQFAELARGEWIGRADNIIFAGPDRHRERRTSPSRSASRPLAQRRRVLFIRAADVVRMLLEARDARELGRLQRRLQHVDLLILDELGFVPFDRAGGELLFNLLAERYERRSVVVTTNLAFAEWVKVFGGDEKLTTALLDRLAHHATVIATKGKSFRMRKKEEMKSEPERPERRARRPCPNANARRRNQTAGWISFRAAKWISF